MVGPFAPGDEHEAVHIGIVASAVERTIRHDHPALLACSEPRATGGRAEPRPRDLLVRSVGKTVPKLLDELSEVAECRLRAAPNLADDSVAVRFVGVRLGDALDNIAEALRASWVKKDEYWLLQRTDKDLAQFEAEWRASQVRALRAQIDAWYEKLQAEPKFDEEAAKELVAAFVAYPTLSSAQERYRVFQSIQDSGPSARALARLAKLIGPEAIAAATDRVRTVFAIRPNSLQRAMPREAASVLADYVRSHNLFAEAYGPGRGAELDSYLTGCGIPNAPLDADSVACVLVVESTGAMSMTDRVHLNLSLRVLDPEGRILARTHKYFVAQDFAAEQEAAARVAPPEREVDEFDVTPDSFEYFTAWKLCQVDYYGRSVQPGLPWPIEGQYVVDEATGIARKRALEPEVWRRWRTRILNLEAFDPTENLLSDLSLTYARRTGRSMVAWLSEPQLDNLFLRFWGKKAPLSMLPVLLDWSGSANADVSQDGWFVMRPRDVSRYLSQRLVRSKLGPILRSVDAKGGLGLEDVLAVFRAIPRVRRLLLPERHYMAMVEGTAGRAFASFQGVDPQDCLDILATLPTEALRAAPELTLRYGALNPSQKAAIDFAVFGLVEPRSNPRVARYGYEVTALLPNGLTADTHIRIVRISSPAVKATSSAQRTNSLTASELAREIAGPDWRELERFPVLEQYESFVMGESLEWLISIELPRENVRATGVALSLFPHGARPLRYSELPEAFRNQVEEHIRKIVELQARNAAQPPRQPIMPP